jgi:hypothetical protein
MPHIISSDPTPTPTATLYIMGKNAYSLRREWSDEETVPVIRGNGIVLPVWKLIKECEYGLHSNKTYTYIYLIERARSLIAK